MLLVGEKTYIVIQVEPVIKAKEVKIENEVKRSDLAWHVFILMLNTFVLFNVKWSLGSTSACIVKDIKGSTNKHFIEKCFTGLLSHVSSGIGFQSTNEKF